MQSDARMVENALAHGLAQHFQILRCCDAVINEEIAMLLRNLRISNPKPATSRSINQLPGLQPSGSAPSGFLNVLPPVRDLTGWLSSRLSEISSISAMILALSPRTALNRTDV